MFFVYQMVRTLTTDGRLVKEYTQNIDADINALYRLTCHFTIG